MSHKPNMSLNTLLAALLVAGIVGMLAGFISRQLITPEYLHEDAFPIEVTESAGPGGTAGPTGPEPILGLIGAADIAKGESLAKQCAACHDFTSGGPDRVGPNLWGVVGGPKAHKAGFAYSDDLKASGGNWTYDDLNHFLWKPKSFIAGTKMNFIGLKKPEDRAALVAWLRQQGSGSYGLPSEGDIAAEQAAFEASMPKEEATPGETAEEHGTAGKDDQEAGDHAPKTEESSAKVEPEQPNPTKPAETTAPANANMPGGGHQ